MANSVAKAKFLIDSLFFDFVTAETECAVERFKELTLLKRKVRLVQNGFIEEPIDDENASIGREHMILTTVRIARQKSLETLIYAFSRIEKEAGDWRVEIAGPVEDQDYYEELKTLIDSLGLTGRVVFLGELSTEDLISRYVRSSIFCLPSLWESFAISRMEAIYFGLPVLSTDAGCGKSLAPFGSIIVPVGDIGAMADGMLKLIKSEELRKSIAISQKKALISWREVIEAYLSLINN